MKVIFEKTFLENLKRIDNTIKLTKYVIGTIYDDNYTISSDFINNLFSGKYLYNDIRKTSEYPLYSIWENNKKILKADINISEEEKKNFVEPNSNYCFIYCYGLYPDKTEKIAFIIFNSKEINKFNSLDLNLSSNLVEIIFPESTIATVETVMDSDTKFLEGIGLNYGTNIFKKEDDSSNNLITVKSYYRYLRNKKTSGISNDSHLYNNIYGEKIYNNSIFRQLTSIKSFSILEDVSSLKKNGGYLNLLGTIECDTYRLINDYSILKINSNELIDITSIPIIEIEEKSNTGIKFIIDQVNKKLIYSSNNSDEMLNSTIILKLKSKNPITEEIIELKSEEINLIQLNK